MLAAHFFHAGDRERAWRYSRLSGDQAKGIYANVDAASFYTRALDTARRFRGATGTEVAAVAESLGDVRYRLGEFEAAGDAYKLSLRHLAGDRIEEARLLLKQALIPWRLGRYPQALGRVTRGLRLIEGLEDEAAIRERANLFARKAVIRQQQGKAARGDRVVQADDRGRRGTGRTGSARAGAVRPRLGVRNTRAVRRSRLLGACARDLRGARQPRAARGDPQQPRRHRLLPGAVGPRRSASTSVRSRSGSGRATAGRRPSPSSTAPKSCSTRDGWTRQNR